MTDKSPPRDVSANRQAQKWSYKELVGRMLWSIVTPIFSLSPRPMWGWRCMLLRIFGAEIGRDVFIAPTVRIAIPWNLSIGSQSAIGDRAILYSLGKIEIGSRVTVSQGAHLCAGTHDYRDPKMPLVKSPIVLANDCWICADAFIGPGVTVGAGSIIGARGVAVKSVGEDLIAAGNPLRTISRRENSH